MDGHSQGNTDARQSLREALDRYLSHYVCGCNLCQASTERTIKEARRVEPLREWLWPTRRNG